LADKTTQLILEALGKAVADPAGAALHGSKNVPGLFASTALAKQAAQRCREEGYLRVDRREPNGKSDGEVYLLSEKGLAFLLSQVSPKQVLEDLVRAVEARQTQLQEWFGVARQTQTSLDGLRTIAEKVLGEIQHAGSTVPVVTNGKHESNGSSAILSQLGKWQASGSSEDCPLPELFRRVQSTLSGQTIGQFHDHLRQLHEQNHIYLHPWTGPLHDMPEPAYSLLVGHEIAYYASLRR
jgi:hypothetical protein